MEYYDAEKYLKNINRRPLKRTFLIGQPRCGTTLWARLMTMGCDSYTMGDKHPKFYESLINIYQDFVNNGKQYGSYAEAEEEDQFFDEFRGYGSPDKEKENLKHVMANMLVRFPFTHGYAKITNLGFGNELVEPFIKMIRDLFEEDNLKIIWITRDPERIVDSMVSKGIIQSNSTQMEVMINLLKDQMNQFREAYELGDTVTTYEKFIEDPIKLLHSSNPISLPLANRINPILRNKLR